MKPILSQDYQVQHIYSKNKLSVSWLGQVITEGMVSWKIAKVLRDNTPAERPILISFLLIILISYILFIIRP